VVSNTEETSEAIESGLPEIGVGLPEVEWREWVRDELEAQRSWLGELQEELNQRSGGVDEDGCVRVSVDIPLVQVQGLLNHEIARGYIHERIEDVILNLLERRYEELLEEEALLSDAIEETKK
jgi:hypothetical protein